jgi:hypothetical protein
MGSSGYAKATLVAGAIIVVVAIGMIVFEGYFAGIAPGLYLKNGKLSDVQKESLTAMLDLVKLLMNWGIAVIGAAGFFLKLNVEKEIPIRVPDLILTFCIILLAVISLFLGHLAVNKSAETLALEQFPVTNDTIRMLVRYQYVSGLSSIALFGFHVFQFFWARKTDN